MFCFYKIIDTLMFSKRKDSNDFIKKEFEQTFTSNSTLI